MRRQLAETALVAAVAAVGAGGVVSEYAEAARVAPPLFGALALTAVATGLVLLRHRSAPAATLGVLVVTLTYHLLGYPGLAVAAAMYVVGYTLVGDGHSRRSLGLGALAALGVVVVALLPPHPQRGVNLGALVGVATSFAAMLAAANAKRAWRVAADEKLRRITQESDRRSVAERLTIARELHDVLAHTISLISVQAAAGLDAMDTRPAQTRAALTTIRGAAKDAMAELRSTLRVLRDSGATDLPAPQPRLGQVAHLVDQATRAGVQTTLYTEGDVVDVPTGVELAGYRIIQEALTNVLRHARASHATVRIEYRPDALLVEVIDDGRVTADGYADGHGMIGMRERVRAVGGTFDAGPQPGRGFAVRARLDLGGPR